MEEQRGPLGADDGRAGRRPRTRTSWMSFIVRIATDVDGSHREAEPSDSQGGGLCTQRPPTIVATTSTPSSSGSHVERIARRARRGRRGSPGRSLPRRRSSPESHAGVTMVASQRLLDRQACSGCQAGRSSSVRRTPARIPASGSSSSIGASEPFATRAPDVHKRAVRVGAVGLAPPEALGEVAVGRGVAELDGARRRRARRSGGGPPARGTARARSGGAARAAPVSRVSSKASSASRFARSPIACTATGSPAAAPRADDLRELVAARDLHARAVEHPRRLRAERPVHERLQVADAEEVVAEAASGCRARRASVELLVRERLPDAERQRASLARAAARSRARRASRPCRGPPSRRGRPRCARPRASRRRTRPRSGAR